MPTEFYHAGTTDPQTVFALQISFVATKPAIVLSEIKENTGPHISGHLDTIRTKMEAFFNRSANEISFFIQDLKSGELFECIPSTDAWMRVKVDRKNVEEIMREPLTVPPLQQEIGHSPSL